MASHEADSQTAPDGVSEEARCALDARSRGCLRYVESAERVGARRRTGNPGAVDIIPSRRIEPDCLTPWREIRVTSQISMPEVAPPP